ncbi:MAG: hypothetical protein RL238_3316 [Actinomycetota bacterium]|jgi:hypothetical protein
MDCSLLLASLQAAVSSGWHCQSADATRFLVVAPVTYPDGDHPELLVSAGDGGTVTISDFGATAMRLSMSDIAYNTGRANASIKHIAKGYGVYFDAEAELRLDLVETADRLSDQDHVGHALLRLASAMIQIDALRAMQPAVRGPRFDNQLSRFLIADRRLTVVSKHRVRGNTGKTYQVTAAVGVDPNRLIYVQAVVKANASDMRSVDHTFRTFHDVNGVVHADRKIAVLPDHPSEYDPSDIRLLEKVSTVATWADRARLVDYLAAPVPVPSRRLYDDNPGLFADH